MPRTIRHRSRSARPFVEDLEARKLLSRRAVLDFDGEDLTAAEMTQGGWGDKGATSAASFKDLFTSARSYLDANRDGAVNLTDANLAIGRIVDKVKLDYAAYDLDIIVGDQDDYQGLLTDSVVGDVMVIVTGGRGFDPGYGIARVDRGNEREDIAWAFSGRIADDFRTAETFINTVAFVVSHEMGHAFGLSHVLADPTGNTDAITHHLMAGLAPDGSDLRDFDHDFNFQDRSYRTQPGYAPSAKHPEWNVDTQNAHQLLSHPDVLGPSGKPWLAALTPGVLTITGSDAANNISVAKGPGNQWIVKIDGATYNVDARSPGLNSPNPFDDPLTEVRISGKDGDDTITASTLLGANVRASGGAGVDAMNVNDESNVLASTYTFTASFVSRTGAATISYDVENLAVTGGSGDDTFNVEGSKAGMNVSFYGQGGSDVLNVSNKNDPAASTYTISSTAVSRAGAATIRYDVETLGVTGGAGNDTFNVESSKPGMAVKVLGQGGSDTLNVNDSASTAGNTYRLTSSTVSRTGAATIRYDVENLAVTGGGGDDVLYAESINPATKTSFFGGKGTNRVTGPYASRVLVS